MKMRNFLSLCILCDKEIVIHNCMMISLSHKKSFFLNRRRRRRIFSWNIFVKDWYGSNNEIKPRAEWRMSELKHVSTAQRLCYQWEKCAVVVVHDDEGDMRSKSMQLHDEKHREYLQSWTLDFFQLVYLHYNRISSPLS